MRYQLFRKTLGEALPPNPGSSSLYLFGSYTRGYSKTPPSPGKSSLAKVKAKPFPGLDDASGLKMALGVVAGRVLNPEHTPEDQARLSELMEKYPNKKQEHTTPEREAYEREIIAADTADRPKWID